jgi:hypothetical protein
MSDRPLPRSIRPGDPDWDRPPSAFAEEAARYRADRAAWQAAEIAARPAPSPEQAAAFAAWQAEDAAKAERREALRAEKAAKAEAARIAALTDDQRASAIERARANRARAAAR